MDFPLEGNSTNARRLWITNEKAFHVSHERQIYAGKLKYTHFTVAVVYKEKIHVDVKTILVYKNNLENNLILYVHYYH